MLFNNSPNKCIPLRPLGGATNIKKKVDEVPDVEGAAVGGDDDEEEAEEGEDYESDDEEIYWFDCPFCKNIWLREDLRDQHMMTCDQRV